MSEKPNIAFSGGAQLVAHRREERALRAVGGVGALERDAKLLGVAAQLPFGVDAVGDVDDRADEEMPSVARQDVDVGNGETQRAVGAAGRQMRSPS